MTSIRNLPLAVRLGGAFGALCVALAIIAFTGIHSMNGVAQRRREPRQRASRGRRSARRHPGARQGQREPDRRSTCTSTTATCPPQDKIAEELAANVKANSGRAAAEAREARSRAREAEPEYAAYAKARGTLVDAMQRAIATSRAETVRNAEERDGSRTIFIGEVLKADTGFEQAG